MDIRNFFAPKGKGGSGGGGSVKPKETTKVADKKESFNHHYI